MGLNDLSFFDIQALNIDKDLKDELTLGFLHGLSQLNKYIKHPNVDYETLRQVRLAMEHDVPLSLIDSNLNITTLTALRRLYSNRISVGGSGLDKYFYDSFYHLEIEPELFEVLTEYVLRGVSILKFDFKYIPLDFAELLLSYYEQGVETYRFIPLIEKFDKSLAYPYVELLSELSLSGIDITPFLSGIWSIEQVQTIIQGNSIINATEFVERYINEYFTAGQIEMVLKAIQYNCADIVCSVDEDHYPRYNEYQMYHIVEGARFGLDYMSYADPMLSDYEMHERRARLLDIKDRETRGGISSKLRVLKPVSIDRTDLGI